MLLGQWKVCVNGYLEIHFLTLLNEPVLNVKRRTQLFVGNPSQSYGMSPAISDHTVLPAA